MSIEITKASQNIASNLVNLRMKSGLTQDQLAKLSDTKRTTIALLESGSSNPTLEVLLKIIQGLKISLDELLSSPHSECQLIKAVDIPLDKRSKNGVCLRKLLPDKLPATELDELILEPDCILTGSPHVEGTREYFICIKGEIMIGVLGNKYHLFKGDVLSFSGDKPHSYKNVGRTTAQGISAVFFTSNFSN